MIQAIPNQCDIKIKDKPIRRKDSMMKKKNYQFYIICRMEPIGRYKIMIAKNLITIVQQNSATKLENRGHH